MKAHRGYGSLVQKSKSKRNIPTKKKKPVKKAAVKKHKKKVVVEESDDDLDDEIDQSGGAIAQAVE